MKKNKSAIGLIVPDNVKSIDKGYWTKVIQSVKETACIFECNFDPLFQFNFALKNTGKKLKAKVEFEKVLKIDPSHIGAITHLSDQGALKA